MLFMRFGLEFWQERGWTIFIAFITLPTLKEFIDILKVPVNVVMKIRQSYGLNANAFGTSCSTSRDLFDGITYFWKQRNTHL